MKGLITATQEELTNWGLPDYAAKKVSGAKLEFTKIELYVISSEDDEIDGFMVSDKHVKFEETHWPKNVRYEG